MAFSYSPKIVTDGLVLYLDAGNSLSYPGSGNNWTDLSRGRNDGTLTNGPTFNSVNGGAIVFDGVNDYVNCGNNQSIQNISTGITLSTVIDGPTLSGTYGGLLMKTSISSWNDGFGLYYENIGTKQYGFYINNWGSTPLLYPIPTTNQTTPIMLTGTYSTTTNMQFYINGILYNSRNYSTPINNPSGINLNIGCANTASYFYRGKVYLSSIYNRALSASEVLQNYNATKARFGL